MCHKRIAGYVFLSSHLIVHGDISALHTDEYDFCNDDWSKDVNILHECGFR